MVSNLWIFPGLIPKLNVRPGDMVSAGSPLFHDKIRPEIIFTSPVSGKVVSVIRGDRRKLLEVVVEKSGNEYVDFGVSDPSGLSREKIKESLLISGLWPAVRQRPISYCCKSGGCSESNFHIRI